jgi:hypothetical protein
VSIVSLQPASDTVGVAPISPSVPALLNATSKPPNRRTAVSTRGSGEALVLDVASQRHGQPSRRCDFCDQCVQFGLPPRSDDQPGALPGKEFRCRVADSGTCSGDDGNLVRKCSHVCQNPMRIKIMKMKVTSYAPDLHPFLAG